MIDPLGIGVRFALYADLMLMFGLPLFALYAPSGSAGPAARRAVLLWLAVGGLALNALSIVAMTASMSGVGLTQVAHADIRAMIVETPMGKAWVIRSAAIVVFAAAVARGRGVVLPSICAAIALGSLAWTGHGAAGEGTVGTVQLVGDVIHLFSSAAWFGALVALTGMLLGSTDTATAHRALARFALAGTIIVLLVAFTGLLNTLSLVGWTNIANLPSTTYGQLLLAKLALFTAMLGLASLNRFRLTPALSSAEVVTRAVLRRSLLAETSAAVAILALVAWLGTLEPPTTVMQ